MEKLIKVKVDNSNVMRSIEKAGIKVTSPTGKSVTLKKINLGNKFSENQTKLFWKLCNDPMTKFVGEVVVTLGEMQTILEMSKK